MLKILNGLAYISAHVVIAIKDLGYILGGAYYYIAYHMSKFVHQN